MRPRALDLFCGAGGASMGLHRAGFEVTGVDIRPQKRYPFTFRRADALEFPLEGYALIWASPPCQAYSSSTKALRNAGKEYPDLVAATRARLVAVGVPWVIENVVGAPIRTDVQLCGRMFGLQLIRHRNFEVSGIELPVLIHPCAHDGTEIPCYGNGTSSWHLEKRNGRGISVAEQRAAFGIDWMTRAELSQAIPPAYSEWIGAKAIAAGVLE